MCTLLGVTTPKVIYYTLAVSSSIRCDDVVRFEIRVSTTRSIADSCVQIIVIILERNGRSSVPRTRTRPPPGQCDKTVPYKLLLRTNIRRGRTAVTGGTVGLHRVMLRLFFTHTHTHPHTVLFENGFRNTTLAAAARGFFFQ